MFILAELGGYSFEKFKRERIRGYKQKEATKCRLLLQTGLTAGILRG